MVVTFYLNAHALILLSSAMTHYRSCDYKHVLRCNFFDDMFLCQSLLLLDTVFIVAYCGSYIQLTQKENLEFSDKSLVNSFLIDISKKWVYTKIIAIRYLYKQISILISKNQALQRLNHVQGQLAILIIYSVVISYQGQRNRSFRPGKCQIKTSKPQPTVTICVFGMYMHRHQLTGKSVVNFLSIVLRQFQYNNSCFDTKLELCQNNQLHVRLIYATTLGNPHK